MLITFIMVAGGNVITNGIQGLQLPFTRIIITPLLIQYEYT